MDEVRILRQQYRRLRQADLATFSEHVVKQTLDAPTFAPIRPLIAEFDALQKQYAVALAGTLTGNREAQVVKDDVRLKLLAKLNEVADGVDKLAAGVAAVIVAAGFEIRQPALRFSGVLTPPLVVSVRSTGFRGEVMVNLRDAFPRAVRTHGIEISSDGGATWTNSSYNSRSRFRLGKLPNHRELQIRFNTIGRGDTRSEWSEAVLVAVS
jgi:hypothetical protein